MECPTQGGRDQEQVNRERRRYAFLEQLYLLTGENCERAISPREIETQMETPAAAHRSEVEDLVRRGYVQYAGRGGEICVTEKGIRYLQKDAWRRRSVRD